MTYLMNKYGIYKPINREPEFHCAVEVHARLGLTLKYLGLLNWSRIHLNWALENSSQNSDDFRGPMTVAEIKFHLGHVCELQKRHQDAKKYYQQGKPKLLNRHKLTFFYSYKRRIENP